MIPAPGAMTDVKMKRRIRTLLFRGITGQSCIDPRSAFAKSWTLRMLSSPQLELYPKLCIRTFWNLGSCGSHSFGQYRDGSLDFVQVLFDPPPRPCTNTRSAIAWLPGSNKVFNPNGPLPSSDDWPPGSRLVRVRERKERPEDVASVFERSIAETPSYMLEDCASQGFVVDRCRLKTWSRRSRSRGTPSRNLELPHESKGVEDSPKHAPAISGNV